MLWEFVMSNCENLDAITTAGSGGLVRVDDSHIVCFFFKSFPVFKTFSNQRRSWWEEGEVSDAAAPGGRVQGAAKWA